ncbi:MAG: trehalose-phosphatase [Terriglobales bacterium]
MSITAETLTPRGVFFSRLAATTNRVLFLDYDGTLAPFVPDRRCAVPYPGVLKTIAKVRSRGTRVVVASGRMAREVRGLLNLSPPLEIWGSHGFERLMPDGEYRTGHMDERLEQGMTRAHENLVYEGLGKQVEVKPCGIAVHWRGYPAAHAREVAAIAERILKRLIDFDATLVGFDGGIELRARGYDKGHVVRTVMAESPVDAIAAFLGDDLTDEDGFRAVQPHGTGVLVRQLHRPTEADIWLRPPAELEAFLNEWCEVTGGAR